MLDSLKSLTLLNSDLRLIMKWAVQRKMSFNPDPSKQAVDIIFSKKLNTSQHPALIFNNDVVCSKDSHKTPRNGTRQKTHR